MVFVESDASLPMVIVAVAGGFLGAAVAVSLAKTIPVEMELETRDRPSWWWGAAYLVGGLYGWLITATVDSWALLPAFLVFGAATLALTLIDLDHQLIPNRVLFPSLGIAAALLAVGALIGGDGGALLRGIAGAAAYFGGLLVVGLVARGGFGMGDVKLAILLGLFLGYLGWDVLAVGSVSAVLLGGIASGLLLIVKRKQRNAKFAYGPYLVLGAWIGLIWGERIADWYLRTGV